MPLYEGEISITQTMNSLDDIGTTFAGDKSEPDWIINPDWLKDENDDGGKY